MKKIIFIITLFFLSFIKDGLKAQDGTVDSTFGTNGTLTIPSGNSDYFKAVAIQPDGKIVLGGSTTNSAPPRKFYITRRNSDGTMDASFNGGVPNIFTERTDTNIVMSLALQADGSILYGGNTGGNPILVTVGKLDATGIKSNGFPTSSYYVPTTDNMLAGLAYDKINNKIVLGGYNSSTMVAFKFLTTGAKDVTFGSNGQEAITLTPAVQKTGAVVAMPDGSTLLAGLSSNAGVNVYTVVKLKSNGSPDASFGTQTPLNGIAQVPGATGNPYAMALQSDGKILMAGNSSNALVLLRLNSNGTRDNLFHSTSFVYPFSNTTATSIFIQPDKKIVVSGNANSTSSYGLVMRFEENGDRDSTFGINGLLSIPNVVFNGSDINIKDGTAIFAGTTVFSPLKLIAVKVKLYDFQKYNIIGKDIVSIGTENSFYVNPVIPGYTYVWHYSSSNIYTLGSSINDTITLAFSSITPSGTLTCNLYKSNGTIAKKLTKEITVNPKPTLADMLTPVKCAASQTSCETNYINSFSFTQTKLVSTNTGCSETGYSDLTASGIFDTLYIGDNYQANIICSDSLPGTNYAGIWIDLNNDGQIVQTDSKEFVGTSFSEGAVLTVNNILVPAGTDAGPKRVRVRVRKDVPFSTADFCAADGELSETEDYLILLLKYEEVLAPNFITPNDDGKNDNFIVRGLKDNVKNSLKVFSPTGDLVYDKENYDNSWDGKDKNNGRLKPGTYYYVFTQENSSKSKDDVVKGFFEIRY
jgi:uncharacterized delta-60 repeat protein/gliding motility-associated-like protein